MSSFTSGSGRDDGAAAKESQFPRPEMQWIGKPPGWEPGRKDGLTRKECDVLARYNSEVYRGIVHTAEWKLSMAELQERFDAVGVTPRRRRRLRADV